MDAEIIQQPKERDFNFKIEFLDPAPKALKFLTEGSTFVAPKLSRMIAEMCSLDARIVFVPGTENRVADCLSLLQVLDEGPVCTDGELMKLHERLGHS